MQRFAFALIGFLSAFSSIFAQNVITGRVHTLQGKAVENARVLALAPADSTILGYTFTDATGSYR